MHGTSIPPPPIVSFVIATNFFPLTHISHLQNRCKHGAQPLEFARQPDETHQRDNVWNARHRLWRRWNWYFQADFVRIGAKVFVNSGIFRVDADDDAHRVVLGRVFRVRGQIVAIVARYVAVCDEDFTRLHAVVLKARITRFLAAQTFGDGRLAEADRDRVLLPHTAAVATRVIVPLPEVPIALARRVGIRMCEWCLGMGDRESSRSRRGRRLCKSRLDARRSRVRRRRIVTNGHAWRTKGLLRQNGLVPCVSIKAIA